MHARPAELAAPAVTGEDLAWVDPLMRDPSEPSATYAPRDPVVQRIIAAIRAKPTSLVTVAWGEYVAALPTCPRDEWLSQ